MSRRTAHAQPQSSDVICLDSDDEAGPSTRAVPAPRPARSGGGARRGQGRQRSTRPASPTVLVRGAAVGQQQRAAEAVSLEVVDLTAGSLEDDVVTPVSKRSRTLPLPFSAPQPPPPPAKPDAKCAICLEPMAEMACGPCGHVFCDSCLRASVKVTRRCPTCRKGLQARQIHRIYLSLD